jgi:hypothetical protein
MFFHELRHIRDVLIVEYLGESLQLTQSHLLLDGYQARIPPVLELKNETAQYYNMETDSRIGDVIYGIPRRSICKTPQLRAVV